VVDPVVNAPDAGQMNVASGTRSTPVADLLASIIALVDADSGTLTSLAYRPYGTSEASPSPFGYTGQRVDAEVNGLYYYRARHYSTALGRFLQADPIGDVGGALLYAYVANDPLNQVDPNGLFFDSAASAANKAVQLTAGFAQNVYQDTILRAGNDVAREAERFAEQPLAVITKFLNSFPATRVEGEFASATIAVGTLALNAKRGLDFQAAVVDALGVANNTIKIEREGLGRSIPDVLTTSVTEIKNSIEVNNSIQLRIQAAYAAWKGIPFNLIVSPATQRVSLSVQTAVEASGGTIQRFNPLTGTFTPFQ